MQTPLSYFADLTRDSLRWTATTGEKRVTETVRAYDTILAENASVYFTPTQFALAVRGNFLAG